MAERALAGPSGPLLAIVPFLLFLRALDPHEGGNFPLRSLFNGPFVFAQSLNVKMGKLGSLGKRG